MIKWLMMEVCNSDYTYNILVCHQRYFMRYAGVMIIVMTQYLDKEDVCLIELVVLSASPMWGVVRWSEGAA